MGMRVPDQAEMHTDRRWLVPGVVAALLIIGCASRPSSTTSDAVEQAPPPTQDTESAESTIASLLPTANARQGRLLFLQCRACHSLEQGGENKIGPNLHGLFSSKAGQVKGFDYSDALIKSAIAWTPRTLDEWLARPSDFLPGNRMVFAGITDPRDRANLIAYLQQATAIVD